MADDGTLRDRRCNHCGHPMPDMARFCAECGAAVKPPGPASAMTLSPTAAARPNAVHAPAPPAAALRSAAGAKTVMGFGAMTPLRGGNVNASAKPDPSAPAAPAASPAALGALQRTMVGLAQSGPRAPPPGVASPADLGSPLRQTMLGIAMPGIAPLEPTEPPPTLPTSTPVPTPRYPPLISSVPPSVSVVPAPAPLVDMPMPASARLASTTGVPIATVALVAGVLLLAGGAGIAWFWRGASTVTAQPHSSPTGQDTLHLHCNPSSCRDGTTVEVAGEKATFVGGEADLTLAEPLHIGDNPLALHVDRPGLGRDEVLKLVVPVAFRVRADAAPMSALPPSIAIRVEAIVGSQVTVDGKPLALDSAGSGVYSVDESGATEGPADESRVVSLDVPYMVVGPAGSGQSVPEKGTVSARVTIGPLHVDAPGPGAVLEGDHVLVAGRAAKGANVTVDGAPVDVGPEGSFEANVSLPALGERTVEVRAETASLRARTVHLSVKRVASLADEGWAFERREKSLGYDAATRDLGSSVGRPMVVDGEVIDSRHFGYGAVLLVDDRRGCAKGPCLARVLLGQDLALARGATVRAFGHIARPFTTPNGQSVPEVDANFVVPQRR
jgi:hypothetical protein